MADTVEGARPRPGPGAAETDGSGEASARVERAFSRIAGRMAALPICNPSLRVEAVGLRRQGSEWLGVLITPWTISLILLPAGRPSALRPLGEGQGQRWRFPSGDYPFVAGDEPEIGPFQTCSLLSPTGEVGSQEEARALAHDALVALLRPPDSLAGPAAPPPSARAAAPAAPPAPSRRAFLTLGAPGRRR